MVGRMINHYVIGFLVYPESLEWGYVISESNRIVAAVFFFVVSKLRFNQFRSGIRWKHL